MSYRDGNENDPAGSRHWYWPSLDSLEDSYLIAQKAFGGWVFAGMVLLGGLATYFSGKRAIDLQTPETDMVGSLIGVTIELLFVLFASYRMKIGRGWIVSWLLLALFAGEALMKIFGGGRGVIGWIFFYFAVGASLLAGARACWDIHSRLNAGETLEPTEQYL